MGVTARPGWTDASALLKHKGEQLYFSEAPRTLQLAVGLGAVGKGVMTLAPFLGKLFFVPLAVGGTMMGGSFLLLVSGPVSIRIDREKDEIVRWRKGLRLPGTRRHRMADFDRVAVVELEGGGREQFAVRLEHTDNGFEPLSYTIVAGPPAGNPGGEGQVGTIARDLASRIADFTGYEVRNGRERAEVAIAYATAGAVPTRTA